MFKKRLKGLLAMVLAGSIAATALSLSASATFDGNIGIVDTGGGTVYPNYDIVDGYDEFYSGCLKNDPSRLTENNLWAISYKEGGTDKLECVTGNNLYSKLKEMKDSTNTYSNVEIKSEHDILVTTRAGSPDGLPTVIDEVSQTTSVSVFPHEIDISSYFIMLLCRRLSRGRLGMVWNAAMK